VEVVIPSFGSPGDEVRLEEWLVKPGESIKAGQPFFVVTTDKATVEVEAFRDGIVQELRVEPGSSVPVGAVVAILSIAGEEVQKTRTASERPETTPLRSTALLVEGRREGRVLASPLARRMAQEAGISLEDVHGSGRQGQVLRRDVERLLAAPAGRQAELDEYGVRARRAPVSSMRRAVAERTRQSKAEAPHFYATQTIDMTEAKAAQSQLAGYAEENGLARPTINDLILKATALALRKTPDLNASLRGDEILYFEEVNIGLVIGLEAGMIVPVIRQADHKSLFALAAEADRLKERARQGQLKSSELLGSTFSLSNLGMYGLDSFSAVINPPEAGMLAVGAVKQALAYWKGAATPRWRMTATLSVDHRLVDGITAAKFMQALQTLLENPIYLTIESTE
jgi:pyruvate dehydrogenase E2 component (dihydrolipoamide acetyltransferase)